MAELEKDERKAETIRNLLGKLGPATVKPADKCEDEKVAEKVRALGEALQGHGMESDEEG